MAAVAAIHGTRRGVERARREARIKRREELTQDRKEATARYRKETEMVTKLMETYDTNKSDVLEADQVSEMLKGYTFHLKGHNEHPTKDEVDCLLALCDKTGNGAIDRKELTNALVTWFAYVEKGDETRTLLQKHDLTKTGKINEGELKPLLVELNGGQDVPDDVLDWVWKQADLTGDGTLNQFELTRAIAAWYVWLPEDQPGGDTAGALGDDFRLSTMPQQFRKSATSACCTLQ
eukprot:gnl/TRDRNA2_/TRDRNA2_191730_c0_seq1.p1 gnl/TRDRNA2_/TRDRNA2_191730_c0~~gnl/TRDRNA2_/TRDRNA2_191730_c0_seq1.p1  ORF type:complete len:245 (+),score=41.56 gnl/TRDRNA2_/TRDRNA2_191730_c0_seq1:33-737(+)